MKIYLLFLSVLLLSTSSLFAQPANDDCGNAELITLTTANQNIGFSISDAQVNNEVGCQSTSSSNYVDIWYEFTMPVTGNVFINGQLNWNRFAIYDACGGSEVACFQTSSLVTDLVQGNSYKLRVFRTEAQAGNSFQSFSIQAFEKPLNDECTDAETLSVTTSSTNVNFSIPGADINLEEGCAGTSPSNHLYLWYEFTMPVTGNLYIDGTFSWNQFAIYDACGGNEVTCFQTRSFVTDLVQGNSYKLRVFRTEAQAGNSSQSFNIQAFEKPLNDECTDAETLNITTSSTNVSFSIPGADINLEEGCAGTTPSNLLDLWYEFTMPVTGNLYVQGDISWNNFAIYDACSGNEVTCFQTRSLVTDLTQGNTYKLRVFRTESLATNGFQNFKVQAFEKPANDECTNAENLNVTTSSTNVSFSIPGADINLEEACEGSTTSDYLDIWYEFTMPVNGNIIIDGVIGWNNFALYDSCGSNEINCFTTSGTTENLVSGNTYSLRVFRTLTNAFNLGFQSFSIQAFEVVPNDDCIDAENIDLTSGAVNLNFSISGANLNSEEGCVGSGTASYADVWYAFEMPFSGDLFIDGNISWNQFAIYDSCGGNELYCFDNQNLIQALNVGDYVLRVFRTEALALNSNFQSFSIQAFENSTNCAGITIWDGVEWNNGLPDNTTKAIVNDDYLLSTEIEWCELEVADGTYTIDQNAKLILNETTRSLSVSSNGKLHVEGILDVAGSIENSGDLVFISNSVSTGQLDMMNSGATVSGDVQVQRFIPAGDNARRAFRFLSSAVSSTNSIRANWQEGVNNTGTNFPSDNQNPNPGYGTHISGSSSGANGFDATTSGNPSLFTFDNTFLADQPGETQSDAWENIPNTNFEALSAGEAYLTFIRGDRSINITSNSATPTNTTLRATGSLHIGDFSPTISDKSEFFSLIGNPYQAIVDFNLLNFSGDVNTNNMFVWNPNANTRGAYETIDTAVNQMIQPGQSFFVQNLTTVNSNPGITFTEAAKNTSGLVASVFDNSQVKMANLELYNNNDEKLDILKFRFEANANNSIDEFDAGKLLNPDENLASLNNTTLLSVERRDIPQNNEIVPLFINQYRFNEYKFKIDLNNWDTNINIYIIDNYLNTETLIESDQDYSFYIDSNIPESIATDRFNVSFENTSLSVGENEIDQRLIIYPNPSEDGLFYIKTKGGFNGITNVKMTNILGQEVFNKNITVENNSEIEIHAYDLSKGIYIVELIQDGNNDTAKLIVK
jgi:hypothetical protein